MVGRQERIGCSAEWRYTVARVVNYKRVGGITGTNTANISDVVAKQGDRVVQLVIRALHLLKMLTAENLLANKGYKHRVLHIMVECIAIGDYLQDRASR